MGLVKISTIIWWVEMILFTANKREREREPARESVRE
jgi:hypothetical protein